MPQNNIIFLIVITIIMIPLNALLLMLTTKMFKLAEQGYKKAFLITLATGFIGLVFSIYIGEVANIRLPMAVSSWVLVGILISAGLIKKNYELDWDKALLVWLVYFLLSLVVAGILIFFLSVSLTSQFFGMLSR